jgi:Resolvase, N terminal domain
MDGLYFRVSSERQTTENQFNDLLQVAEKDGSWRNWSEIRAALSRCVIDEHRPGSNGVPRTVYRVDAQVATELARECVYVEQGRSGKIGARQRPLFEQMKRDAAARKFDRLLVWKVSRLGRDMREVIATVYELADLGITVVPVKSQTGPISSTMGKLLWAIQAWDGKLGKVRRHQSRSSEGPCSRQAPRPSSGGVRPRSGDPAPRPGALVGPQIARRIGAGVGTVVRAYRDRSHAPQPFQKCDEASL